MELPGLRMATAAKGAVVTVAESGEIGKWWPTRCTVDVGGGLGMLEGEADWGEKQVNVVVDEM